MKNVLYILVLFLAACADPREKIEKDFKKLDQELQRQLDSMDQANAKDKNLE